VEASRSLEIRNVSKAFAEHRVLESINLTISDGEFVSIIGSSGCGKTTLLRLLAGLELITEGNIAIQGHSIAEARARQEIGIAFQQPALIPSLTARQNVQTTLDLSGRRSTLAPETMLSDFGLSDFIDHYPHQLSGGMQQRVNIGCAMVHQPQLLLLDEPFGALDEMTRASMCSWLATVLQTSGQTTVLVTHSIEEAVMLSDRIIVLATHPGRIFEILTIDLPRPRKSWEDDAFIEEMKRVRQSLKSADTQAVSSVS
jgi:NitT/TauT family transport system ATP-binding protein